MTTNTKSGTANKMVRSIQIRDVTKGSNSNTGCRLDRSDRVSDFADTAHSPKCEILYTFETLQLGNGTCWMDLRYGYSH